MSTASIRDVPDPLDSILKALARASRSKMLSNMSEGKKASQRRPTSSSWIVHPTVRKYPGCLVASIEESAAEGAVGTAVYLLRQSRCAVKL